MQSSPFLCALGCSTSFQWAISGMLRKQDLNNTSIYRKNENYFPVGPWSPISFLDNMWMPEHALRKSEYLYTQSRTQERNKGSSSPTMLKR